MIQSTLISTASSSFSSSSTIKHQSHRPKIQDTKPKMKMLRIRGCCFQFTLLALFTTTLLISSISASSSNESHRTSVLNQKKDGSFEIFRDVRGGSKRPTAAMEGLKNSISSGLASVCAKTLLQPFDTIKTVQQHAKGETAIGLLEAAKMIAERENGSGVSELYAGLAVFALGGVPAIGLYYGIYSYCKRIFIPYLQSHYGSLSTNHEKGQKPILSNPTLKLIAVAMSAALGNTVASFSRVPYEVVKQKLQTGEYTNTLVAISSMFQKEGMRAFFPMGGVHIQMLRDIPYAIFTLLAYEFLRDTWVDKNHQVWKDMAAGAAAGGFGAYMTNGLDVIKTRLQINPEIYNGSVILCAKLILEEGGFRAFLRGSTSRLMHKIPANAMFFFFYEFFRRFLRVDTLSLEGKREEDSNKNYRG